MAERRSSRGRGRPPIPTEVKRARGNPGKRALPTRPAEVVQLAAAREVPASIRPLGPAGTALWERVWGSGARWISPETDLELVQILCETLDERVAVRVDVIRKGTSATPKERRMLRDLDRQVVEGLSILGFTPTDRARLGLAEVVAQTKLEELRRGAAARRR